MIVYRFSDEDTNKYKINIHSFIIKSQTEIRICVLRIQVFRILKDIFSWIMQGIIYNYSWTRDLR